MQEVVAAAGGRIDWVEAHAGLAAAERFGDPLPDATLDLDPPLPRRPQGAVHHAHRQGLPLHQRPPAPGARPVRQRPPGAARCRGVKVPLRATSISSSSARTPRGCTPAWSTSSCPASSRACASSPAPPPSASSATPSSWPGSRAGGASRSATRPTCCRSSDGLFLDHRPRRWPTITRSWSSRRCTSTTCACSWRWTRRGTTCW